jgi:uncharacterized protein YndB with AHSA1/START domain
MVAAVTVPVQIVKEILIEAPIEDVWRVVTEPDQITQWFSQEAELERRTDGAGRLHFESGQTYYLHVEAFEPPHRFAYRWLHERGANARPENSMLVEFTLHAEAGRTRLRVVESGFDHVDWTDEKKVTYLEEHSRGWEVILEQLRVFAPRANTTARE